MAAELVAASDQAKAIAQAAERHKASVVLVEAPGTGLAARLRGRRLARRVRRLSHAPRLPGGSRTGWKELLMFDIASLAIAGACLLVAFGFIYLLDRV